MAKEYYIDENVNSRNFNPIKTGGLYDAQFLQGIDNAKKIAYTPHDLNKLYNHPGDKVPYTETLKNIGKVDKRPTDSRYFSPTQLYNRDGRYMNNGVTKSNNYYGSMSDNKSSSRYKYNYATEYNTFNNTRYGIVSGDDYDKWLMELKYSQKGVINPNAGKPIRLSAPSGFTGYISCLTKGNTIGKVELASSPNNISDSLQVDIASDTAIGRPQGFNFFSSVGTRQVQFSFDVYADYLPAPFNDVLSYCKALKQMNYPTYSSGGKVVNSPLVMFEYGGIHIKGIPTITFTFDNTIRKGNIDKANVSVSIVETEPIVDGKAIL